MTPPTSTATSALVSDGDVLGERTTTAVRVLEDVDALLVAAGIEARELDALAVGVGPGSFTGVRMGLAAARGLALALDIPVAGVSTLAALAAGAPDAVPLIDAKRHELFLEVGGKIVALPAAMVDAPGRTCVGDGAVRYREHLERTGADRPSGRQRAAPAPCALPRAARARFRAGRSRRAGLRARARRRSDVRLKTAVDIRSLALTDLNSIEEIERRSYPTPWSRSMFAGELAKPTSLCLGAFEEDRLAGYLITSRYVDAWHVMNIAVSPAFRRRGIATALLLRLFELTDDGGRRGYTLEVRVSNDAAIKLYERLGFTPSGTRHGYYTDNREDAMIMWRDPEPADD